MHERCKHLCDDRSDLGLQRRYTLQLLGRDELITSKLYKNFHAFLEKGCQVTLHFLRTCMLPHTLEEQEGFIEVQVAELDKLHVQLT